MMRRGAAPTIASLWLAALAIPSVPAETVLEPVRRVRHLMGTACAGTAYAHPGRDAAPALAAAFDRIAAVEATLSTWRKDSELSRVNRSASGGPVVVGPELASFLTDGLRLATLSGGAFDPTVGPLIDAWDLRGAGRIPSPGELERARESVGHARVHLNREAGTVRFDAPRMWIDAGGIGKGFALDRAEQELRRAGVRAALIDFGGQLLAVGAPPGESAWTVAVADPEKRDRPALLLALRDASAATSAQSERGREVNGRWVGHILDPRTARPVERSGSVTVVAPSATEADALATALFVMGSRDGLRWAEGRGLAVGFLEPVGKTGDNPRWRLHANAPFRSLVVARRGFVAAEPPPGGARRRR